jgi:SAM-dependent methyltransferase
MSNDLSCLPTETVEICVNCRQSGSVRDATFEGWLCLKPPYQVRNCAGCGLRWLSPRPTSVGYETVYSAENYFTAQAGSDVSYENLLDVRVAHFKRRLLSLSRYFPGRSSLKILDYGAATGEFVANAIKIGHSCAGMEFSADARRIAIEKNQITLYSSDEILNGDALFDVIHMNHVFEHMPNPASHLTWCQEHMAENGLLIIEVPQQFNNNIDYLKRLLGRGGKFNGFGAFSLHHTYFFSLKNLKALIENNGFKVEHLTTDVVGARLSGGKKTPKTVLVRLVSWLSNAVFRRGDNIEVYARLKSDSLSSILH